MVIGYGDYKNEVMEYCVSHGMQYEYVLPSGDTYEDIYRLFYRIKKGEEIESLVIYNEADIGGEEWYYYWLDYFLARKRDIIVINEVANPYIDRMFREVGRLKLNNKTKKAGMGIKLSSEKDGKKVTVPFGYARGTDNRYYINPDEYDGVVFVFKRYAEGDLTKDIAAGLNRRHFVSRRGNPFSKGTVEGLLRNRKFYEGYEKTADGWVMKHEPIIHEGSYIAKPRGRGCIR